MSAEAFDESGHQVRQVSYGYDPAGTSLTVSGSAEPVTYTYDALYRVQTLTDGKHEEWKVGEILTILASRKHVLEDIIKRRWLFLVLLWLYQNRDQEIALFDKLGEVYADFDYPDEISSFVPFMPPEDGYDPTTHTLAENHNRILGKWKEYLDTAELSNFHRASLTLVRVILC